VTQAIDGRQAGKQKQENLFKTYKKKGRERERERDKGAKKHNGKINLLLTAIRTKGKQGRK
jgi:hypothetical protein